VEDGERTVLISSHGLSDIERFADHVGMIKNGKLLLEGRTDEIVDRFRLAEFFTGKWNCTRKSRRPHHLEAKRKPLARIARSKK
jgi:ABC-type multidrug transport system ATPase subunit